MSESKRTPGKWAMHSTPDETYVYTTEKKLAYKVATVWGVRLSEAEANARYICRAVNNFEQLLEAAKRFLQSPSALPCGARGQLGTSYGYNDIQSLEAAIRAAEEE